MPKTLLRLPEVRRRTGANANDIYEGMKNGTFPLSVPIGARTVGWVEDEIDKWIERRIAQRDARAEYARGQRPNRKGGPGRGHKGPMQTTVSTS
jgi:prophage regulatory protein